MKRISPPDEEFRAKLVEAREKFGDLLLCSDFDGTLVTFTGVPSQTRLPEETRDLLSGLAGLEELHLAIISGRGFRELTDLVPLENATLAGNHGLKIRFESGSTYEPEIAEEIHGAIADLKGDVQEHFGGKEGIIIEDKGFGLGLHYRQFEGDQEKVKENFREIWKRHEISALEVIEGAKLMEVRPNNWNKGDAVRLLQEKWEEVPTIYIGDDTTDEDAFQVLREQEFGFPVLVSQFENEESRAQYRLTNPQEVKGFLKDLYQLFQG